MDIVQRAKAIVLSPAAEWRVIEPESGDTSYLFVNYVAILAAIPPVCQFLRRILFGWRGPRFGFRHVHHGVFATLLLARRFRDRLRDGDHHRRPGADIFRAEEASKTR